jgi:hypothetical protein
MQEGRPLAFESSQLKGKNLLKPIYEKEMLAIQHAVKKWHPYLIGRHFKVKIDHDSFKYFLEQRLSSEEQQKWVTKMLGYDFEINYNKGKHNIVVDDLSRKAEGTKGSLCALSILQFDLVEETRIEWKQGQEVCKIIQQLQEDPSSLDKFVWKNNFLWYLLTTYAAQGSTHVL